MTEPNAAARHPMHFDRTVNLGHVLTIVTLLGTMGIAYATYSVAIASHDLRLRFLESQVNSLNGVNIELSTTMFTIRQDVAVIRDRMERLPRQ